MIKITKMYMFGHSLQQAGEKDLVASSQMRSKYLHKKQEQNSHIANETQSLACSYKIIKYHAVVNSIINCYQLSLRH